MPNEIRVLLASRKASFRNSLNESLRAQPDLRIVGSHASGAATLKSVRVLYPDVVLVDRSLTDMEGLDVIEQLGTHTPARSILMTDGADRRELIRTVLRGAAGAIEKDTPLQLLLKCLKSVADGDYWFDRNLTPDLLHYLDSIDDSGDRRTSPGRRPERLTQRERDVFQAVANGMSNREIALKLRLSEHTVKQHLKRIFEKLGISNRVELVLLVAKSGPGPHSQRTKRPSGRV